MSGSPATKPPLRRRAALPCAVGIVVCLLAGCTVNPRNEIAAIAEATLAEVARTAPGQRLCVDRTVTPWSPASEARRVDPPAPPGFSALFAPGVFRGGGGLAGSRIGGVAISGKPGCFDLRGPVVSGDRALMEVHLPGTGWNGWLRKHDGRWRVAAVTTSYYPR